MQFGTADEKVNSLEEGVFIFSQDGTLENFYLGLPERQFKQIMCGWSSKDLKRRQSILDFIENFRTSFYRKDIRFLKNIFSDKGGHFEGPGNKKTKSDSEFINESLTRQKVELLLLSKRQHLDGLSNLFTRNSFIKVSFDDIQVNRDWCKTNFYGVNLRNRWTSSEYYDDSHVFFLIEFKNENEPHFLFNSLQPAEFTKD